MEVRVLNPFSDGEQVWLGLDSEGLRRKVFRVVDVIHSDAQRERDFRAAYVGDVVDVVSQAPLARAVREQDAVIIESVPHESRHRRDDDALERARALGVTSLLTVPLAVNDALT